MGYFRGVGTGKGWHCYYLVWGYHYTRHALVPILSMNLRSQTATLVRQGYFITANQAALRMAIASEIYVMLASVDSDIIRL